MNSGNDKQKQVISVCFGSSCHLKGSFTVTEIIKNFLKNHNLEDTVELKGSLCMGQCASGVNILVNGRMVSDLNSDNTEEIELVLKSLLLSEGDSYDTK